MDFTFPEKYHKVVQFFNLEFGELESTSKLDDEKKLIFYALRQQAENGPCTEPAPSIWYARERYKHNAWKELGNMSKFEAMVLFVRLVEEYLGGEVNWMEKCKLLEEQAKTLTDPKHLDSNMENTMTDDDVRAHMEPNLENIRYLASEVMKLRSELRSLRSHIHDATKKEDSVQFIHVAPVNKRETPEGDSCPHSAIKSLAPPTKPLANTTNIISPPVRPSPLLMTEAALRNNRISKLAPTRKSIGWAEWLGLS